MEIAFSPERESTIRLMAQENRADMPEMAEDLSQEQVRRIKINMAGILYSATKKLERVTGEVQEGMRQQVITLLGESGTDKAK